MKTGGDRRSNPSLKKYILISLFVLAAAVAIGGILDLVLSLIYSRNEPVEHIIGMLEGIIGAIAAGLVLYQLKTAEETEKHQNEIEEASFILQFNQAFITDPNMAYVESLLEQEAYYEPMEGELTKEENRQKVVNYLVYLESLAPLVLNNVLKLEHIDDLFAYRFFIATENVEIQDNELCKYADYYRGCFKLYKEWKQYHDVRKLKTPSNDDNANKKKMRALDQCEKYKEIMEMK